MGNDFMKYMAVGSRRLCGICVAKLQVGFPLALPASMAEARQPSLPNGLPATGVPKACLSNKPLALGPTVLYGSQRPFEMTSASSLKSPCRMRAVGTVKFLYPSRCSLVKSLEKKKNVLSLPLYTCGRTTGPPTVKPKLLK